ncbi:TPA: hypothetical protein ACVU5P_004185 [Vibrio parahaemolyticus]
MSIDLNEWVCVEQTEDDYRIAHFEVRMKGKKPLVIKDPNFEKLLFVTKQYLHTNLTNTERIIRASVIHTPDPDLEWHTEALKTLNYLERTI